jgi:hypothetical protein
MKEEKREQTPAALSMIAILLLPQVTTKSPFMKGWMSHLKK